MSNDEIYEKIDSLYKKVRKYEDSIYYLNVASKKCDAIDTGINKLKTSQYEKVCENCEEAIGREDILLNNLKLSNSNISSINDNIASEIKRALDALNDEIDNIYTRVNSLYNDLDD